MPIYTYSCPHCGKIVDAYRQVDERANGPDCHGPMNKIIVPTMINPLMPEYKCPVSGEKVTSRTRRKEIMREHNLIEKG